MKIKILFLDVDGTLTDGKIYLSKDGELIKAFNIKDGMIIAHLPQYHIIPVVITGRESEILLRRCKELGIKEVYQGVQNKIDKLKKILKKFSCKTEEAAYIGDDINDLECMQACNLIGAPADAVDEVKSIADFISQYNGGEGAVREFIEHIIKINKN